MWEQVKVAKMLEFKQPPSRSDWANVMKNISSLTKYVAIIISISISEMSGRLVYIHDTSFLPKHKEYIIDILHIFQHQYFPELRLVTNLWHLY